MHFWGGLQWFKTLECLKMETLTWNATQINRKQVNMLPHAGPPRSLPQKDLWKRLMCPPLCSACHLLSSSDPSLFASEEFRFPSFCPPPFFLSLLPSHFSPSLAHCHCSFVEVYSFFPALPFPSFLWPLSPSASLIPAMSSLLILSKLLSSSPFSAPPSIPTASPSTLRISGLPKPYPLLLKGQLGSPASASIPSKSIIAQQMQMRGRPVTSAHMSFDQGPLISCGRNCHRTFIFNLLC